MKRHQWIGSVLAIALAALPLIRTAADENKPLVVARDMDLNSLDPGRALCDTCQIYLAATYETLVTLDANNQIVPLLAKSWDVDNQQTHYVFHLADNAVFSDGTPVTAKDVKFSFQRLINLKAGPSFYVDDVKTVTVVDDHTVAIDLKAPDSAFLGILAATFIGITNSAEAMQHGASDADDAATKDTAEPWFLAHSAGSGPYVLTSYRPNDELRLTRNPKYWRKPAPINEVVLRETKDAVAQSQMLENGGADIAMQVDPDTAKSVHSPDVVIRGAPSFNFLYLALSPGAKGNKVPLTPDVREAVAAALDYNGIIDVTVAGQGRRIAVPIPLGFPGGDGHKLPVQDLPRAKQAGQGRAELRLRYYCEVCSGEFVRCRLLAADAEDPARSGPNQHQAAPAADAVPNLAAERQWGRHSANNRLLCTGLLLHHRICEIFCDDARYGLGPSCRRKERAIHV